MPFFELDTFWGAMKKYITVALVAGSIGFYKGCDVGKEMERKKHTNRELSCVVEDNIKRYSSAQKKPEYLERGNYGFN